MLFSTFYNDLVYFSANEIISLTKNKTPKGLDEIFHTIEPRHSKRQTGDVGTNREIDDLDLPKYKIGNPEEFKKSREVLGNIITKRMKTSGGTDIDWLIEHRGGFVILELKTFHDDRIIITKAQMLAYQRLHEKLSKRYLFFIGHDDINFLNPEDSIWVFEMKGWNDGRIPKVEKKVRDESYSVVEQEGYIIERGWLQEIKVKELREKIDAAWLEFEK